jgi:Zn-dependent M28 family amino/carboxypeptidase
MLNLAKHYSQNPPEYSVVFMAFGGEELGILGSKYFTENPLIPLDSIQFMINTDIVGTGSEGITLVNGKVHKNAFELINQINEAHGYFPKIKARGKAANSDHHFFSEKGVPAFFIYTMGGISAYHDVFDQAETLPLTGYEGLFTLITEFVNKYRP